MKKNLAKKSIGYVICFTLTALLLTVFLVIAALIPRRLIKDNMQESAEYLGRQKLFYKTVKGIEGSKADRYADSILLGIVWQLDVDKPLRSVMETAYLHDELGRENISLLDAVINDTPPNQEYIRYWHGSAVILKPLLLIFSLKQIYIFNAALMAVLLLILLWQLFKLRAYACIAGIIAGMISISAWFVPASLEYTWCFLLMLLFSTTVVSMLKKEKDRYMGYAFLVFGMLTSYLDFLTTEIITLLVPLLITVWYNKRIKKAVTDIARTAGYAAAWLAGYISMWVLKWILAALILQRNVWPDITAQIRLRIDGNVTNVSKQGLVSFIKNALIRNIKCLFPFEYGIIGMIAGFSVIALFIFIAVKNHKAGIDKKLCMLYIITAFLPYVRFALLHNHSYIHYFFTYRVQLVTVFSAILLLEEISGFLRKNSAD